MTDARKRRWFQFRLVTAVMMMFVAGGLIWANTRGEYTWVAFGSEGIQANWDYNIGFPNPFWTRRFTWNFRNDTEHNKAFDLECKTGVLHPPSDAQEQIIWSADGAIINGLFAVVVLGAMAVLLEGAIRLHEVRKS